MALIPHVFLPRSMLDMDTWFRPTLEIFDPYDELDSVLGRNMHWLTRPSYLETALLQPKVPRKYRINFDCSGYDPKSLKTEIKDGNLILTGKEENKDEKTGDFSTKEFRKTYKLPKNIEADKLVSFVTGNGQLVIEIPLKVEASSSSTNNDDLFPRIVDLKDGGKQVEMNLNLPNAIDPSKLTVTCKDRDLIIKAQSENETNDSKSSAYYYRRCTLPENTDFNGLKCELEKNKLTIKAPMSNALENVKQIPIEYKKAN